MTDSGEQYIQQALHTLEKCGILPSGETASEVHESAQGEVLVERLRQFAGRHFEVKQEIARLRKELEIFTEVNADANGMLEQKIEEISLLRLITDASSRAMRTQDPLKLILGKIISIAGAENGSILLHNGDIEGFEVRAACGPGALEPEGALFRLTHEISNRAATGEEPVFIDDVGADSRYDVTPEEADGVVSFAAFPLMVESKTIGILSLSSPHPNAFGAETQRIMHIIAGQIAVAVENARLYGEVKKTKDYLEDLVERAGDAIFTLDRQHRLLSWNAGAETIFKREKQSMLGQMLYSMLPESMRPTLREKIQSIIEAENIVTIESELNQENGGASQVMITLSPIHGADGEIAGVSGIAKDITKRRQLETELRELNEAKSNFVSTVSHELRTPLTSIKSLTEVLSHERESLSEENIARYLRVINEECDRLSGLISGLLDLQKLSAGKLEVDFKKLMLADVVRRVTELFEGVALQKKLKLTTDFTAPGESTMLMGDRGQLQRILSNLLSNAIKYTNPGGNIAVRLSREDHNIRLTVADSGIGIPDEHKEKVFERFYRISSPESRSKGGTGLGLAITKELVELHGGRIWVEDGAEGGCSFTVLVPAV